ncbi:hypothetical protein TGAMA5MH_01850 [Trichoderma gamsii]|uniref:Uncharacterized protein n=1 Tax=Trichoderma gamsii TaxID=398673 RepID=A0A2K0TMY7_9HYPO|nr:hypothetical protein TGAMA5MH_01850 [Trichoderma gamsii]
MSSDIAFEPTLSDVLVVRAMLAKTTILPELVGTILDYAEYWARSTAKAVLNEAIAARRVGQGEFDYEGNKFLLRSYPVGLTERAYKDEEDGNHDGDDSSSRDERFSTISPRPLPVFKEFDRDFFQRAIKNASTFSNPARKIVFRISSHDQGWTTDEVPGPFIAAKTWFDAGIERFDASNSTDEADSTDMRQWTARKLGTVEPQVKEAKGTHEGWDYQFPFTPWKGPYEIQRNVMASSDFIDFKVTWTCWDVIAPDSPEAQDLLEQGKGRRAGDGQFVRNLKLGDVVTVWGRAMHRGWINTVESVEIDIYWAL